MASIINASTSGAGGVITTADASGVLNIQTAGTTGLSVTAAQDVYLGTTDTSGVGGQLDKLRIVGTTGANASISQFRYTNDNASPNLRLYKSRSASVGGFTAVQDGDTLSSFQSLATDGTSWINTAQIGGFVDGTVSTGIVPSAFYFSTTNSSGVQTAQAQIRANGNFSFNSGYGSVATAYGCRAWVNFNGTGTVAIRASGNVTSITDNGTGNYTVNMTTAMPDVNYAAVVSSKDSGGTWSYLINSSQTSSAVSVGNRGTGALVDSDTMTVAVFR